MIIGITGSYAAGKDTVAEYLQTKGFVHHSLSDLIRDELRARGQETSRENLIAVGNEIRTKFGPGELAKRALQLAEKNKEDKVVITSIRNPTEVTVLKGDPKFRMWLVDAPIALRFARLVSRERGGDIRSLEDFEKKEQEENSSDPNAQQLKKVAEMADVEIINDKDVTGLQRAVDELLEEEAYKLNLETK